MRACEVAFKKASNILTGGDVVEEFIAAGIYPLGRDEWPNFKMRDLKLEYIDDFVPMLNIPVVRDVGEDDAGLVSLVEHTVEMLLGPYIEIEHNSRLAVTRNFPRLNHVLELSKIPYSDCDGYLFFEKKKTDGAGRVSGRGRG